MKFDSMGVKDRITDIKIFEGNELINFYNRKHAYI